MKLVWLILTLSSVARSVDAENYYRNVLGDQLQPCSSDGMALTGYTRNGRLVLDGCSWFPPLLSKIYWYSPISPLNNDQDIVLTKTTTKDPIIFALILPALMEAISAPWLDKAIGVLPPCLVMEIRMKPALSKTGVCANGHLLVTCKMQAVVTWFKILFASRSILRQSSHTDERVGPSMRRHWIVWWIDVDWIWVKATCKLLLWRRWVLWSRLLQLGFGPRWSCLSLLSLSTK
jgi:hypothetical protein